MLLAHVMFFSYIKRKHHMCKTCKENDFSIHEDNVILHAACQLEKAGYAITLKEYMGKVAGSAAYCDMVIRLDDEIICLVEFKNRQNESSGECDCTQPTSMQIEKYCSFGYPLYVCNGYEEVEPLIDWIISIEQTQNQHYNDSTKNNAPTARYKKSYSSVSAINFQWH